LNLNSDILSKFFQLFYVILWTKFAKHQQILMSNSHVKAETVIKKCVQYLLHVNTIYCRLCQQLWTHLS